MSAQPAVAVHDSLSEVRIFPNASPDFAKIASDLGVSASLATLGEGASLVVALRNDSGEAIDSMRILYHVQKRGRPIPRVTLYGSLAPGAATLFAFQELDEALAGLLNPVRQGLARTGPSQARPVDFYQGAQVTASVDSATRASGRFIGADTMAFFSRLVAEDAARKSFFGDVAGFQSAELSQAQIEQALRTRKCVFR